ERVDGLERRVADPGRRARELGLRLDELATRAARAVRRKVAWERRELQARVARLARGGPEPALRRSTDGLRATAERLRFALAVRVRHGRATVEHAAGRLDALSPLACLA